MVQMAFDEEFWNWFRDHGPMFLMTQRPDILKVLHDYYYEPDPALMRVEQAVAESLIRTLEKFPPKKKETPISNDDIDTVINFLNNQPSGGDEQ